MGKHPHQFLHESPSERAPISGGLNGKKSAKEFPRHTLPFIPMSFRDEDCYLIFRKRKAKRYGIPFGAFGRKNM